VNEITASKIEFSLVLDAAGIKVSEFIPERIVPPIVIIAAGSTYLTSASIGQEYILGLELNAVAATAVNKQATEKLDELIQDVINALPSYAKLVSVAQPYSLQANNAEYLAATISVELRITL
jgi:uncharacterized membrane protein